MSWLVMKMKKQLYLPVLLIILVSLVFGVLLFAQPSTVYAAPDILQLIPSGDGDYTLIATVEPVSSTHWEAVDDPVGSPDDTTTYVSTTLGTQQKDAYTLPNPSLTGTINSVKVYFRAGGINDKPHDYQPFLRLGEVETAGTVQTHSLAAFTTYNQILARPGGGDWTWTDINDLQVAIGLTDTGPGNPICTQVYVEVDYTPPPITNTPDNYPFGTVIEGSTTETGLTHFTVTNNNAFAVNITIGGTDMTGGTTWTLSNDGTAGNMIYGLNAGLEDGSYNVIVNKAGGNTLVSGLAGSGGTQSWGLQFLAPSTMTDGESKSGTVTLTATAA